jgi:hypothetical protein
MTSKNAISSDEADLLLYLADELEPQARAAFEVRLQQHASLRQQLTELQEVDQVLSAAKGMSATSSFVSERALRSTLKFVRETALRPKYLDYANRSGLRLRVPPYAAAAGIAILCTLGFIGWLYTTPPVSSSVGPVSTNNNPAFMPNANFAVGFGLSNGFLPVGVDQYGESSRAIDQELDALSMLSDFEEGAEPQ